MKNEIDRDIALCELILNTLTQVQKLSTERSLIRALLNDLICRVTRQHTILVEIRRRVPEFVVKPRPIPVQPLKVGTHEG